MQKLMGEHRARGGIHGEEDGRRGLWPSGRRGGGIGGGRTRCSALNKINQAQNRKQGLPSSTQHPVGVGAWVRGGGGSSVGGGLSSGSALKFQPAPLGTCHLGCTST
jgi:hypothetical protein